MGNGFQTIGSFLRSSASGRSRPPDRCRSAAFLPKGRSQGLDPARSVRTVPYNPRTCAFHCDDRADRASVFRSFLRALHNWIPLGTLNNVRGVRVAFPTGKLLFTTLINFTPVAVGLAATVFYFRRGHPGWVFWWLWITYGLACYGSFKAWWMPYLFRPDASASRSLPDDVRLNSCVSA